MADQDFNIKVVTTADTSGIRQTSDAIEQLKTKAAEATRSQLGPGVSEILESALSGNVAKAVGLGIVAAAGGAIEIIKQVSQYQAQLNKEIDAEAVSLERAVAGWNELAKSADSLQDIDKLAGNVSKGVEAIISKQKELATQVVTTSQTMQEALLSVWKLSAGFPGIWRPYTDALKDAQAEQKALTQSAIESAAASIRAGEQAKASWEAVKLEPINQAVTEYTAKLKAYEEVQQSLNLDTAEGIQQYKFYADRILETTSRLKELTEMQKKQAAESKRAAEEQDRAKEDAARDQEAAEKLQRLHDETLANSKEELEIGLATAEGDTERASALQRELDTRREITNLMREGLSYEEALPLAQGKAALKGLRGKGSAESPAAAAAEERDENARMKQIRDQISAEGDPTKRERLWAQIDAIKARQSDRKLQTAQTKIRRLFHFSNNC